MHILVVECVMMQKRSLQKSTVSVDEHLAIALPNLLEKNKLYKTLRVVCPPANIVQLSLSYLLKIMFYSLVARMVGHNNVVFSG